MADFAQFRILVDTPSANPGLSFGVYADALAHAINYSRPQFAIGIYGRWGSGKTTLMQAVKSRLTTSNTVIVEFSAWRYEKEEYLLVPLLDTIREGLLAWGESQQATPAGPGLMDQVFRAATMIGKIATSIVAGISFKVGMPGSAELSFEAGKAIEAARSFQEVSGQTHSAQGLVNARGTATFPQSIYHTCFRELQKVFAELREGFSDLRANEGDLRFVVFIDDLDRCLPAGALEVLEAIKLFFEHHGFVFVVGLDRTIVERFIEQRYPEIIVREQPRDPATGENKGPVVERRMPLIPGADYIKKIFQVPFSLAPVQLSQLDELMYAIRSGNELTQDQIDDLQNRVLPHLRVALSDAAVNPREVKRFINAYVLQMKIKQHLDPDIVLALQTINARSDWDHVRQALESHRDEFMRALREEFTPPPAGQVVAPGELGPLELLDADLKNLPVAFIDYVSLPGAVAHKMLDANEGARIEEYLYSVESTGTSHGAVLLDVLPLLAKAKTEVVSLEGADPDKSYLKVSRAQVHLRKARSLIGNLESYPAIRAQAVQLESLADRMAPTTGGGLGVPGSGLDPKRAAAEIDAVMRRIRAYRRQDNLSAETA